VPGRGAALWGGVFSVSLAVASRRKKKKREKGLVPWRCLKPLVKQPRREKRKKRGGGKNCPADPSRGPRRGILFCVLIISRQELDGGGKKKGRRRGTLGDDQTSPSPRGGSPGPTTHSAHLERRRGGEKGDRPPDQPFESLPDGRVSCRPVVGGKEKEGGGGEGGKKEGSPGELTKVGSHRPDRW